MRAPQWSEVRTAQHRARYPSLMPEQAAERNREAQARYRERHAERLALTRKISAVLKRQYWHQDDADVLAADLHRLLGDECIKALRRALGDVLEGLIRRAQIGGRHRRGDRQGRLSLRPAVAAEKRKRTPRHE